MAMNARNLLLIVGAAVVFAVAGIYYFISLPDPSATSIAGSAGAQASGDDILVAGPLGEQSLGDPAATVTVIEYASMTCSHCATFHESTFTPFKEKYIDTGKVHFIFREYPLDALATSAFVMARCLPEERYFNFVDLLFRQQAVWAFSQNPALELLRIGKQAGFTQESFKACLTNQKILDGVNWVKNRGSEEFDVRSTPTFFINGKKPSKNGALSLEDLEQEIEPLL